MHGIMERKTETIESRLIIYMKRKIGMFIYYFKNRNMKEVRSCVGP
jgi:hypothetical protein